MKTKVRFLYYCTAIVLMQQSERSVSAFLFVHSSLCTNKYSFQSASWRLWEALDENSRNTSPDDDIISTIKNQDGVDTYDDRFGGVGRLYANSNQNSSTILSRLREATVVVIGIGGVGSWAAESLCRSGIGTIVLMDLDDICVSNINRQLHALSDSIGQMKVEIMKDRLLQINPHCHVRAVPEWMLESNAHDLLSDLHHSYSITAVLDAMDGAKEKAACIAACQTLHIPVVSCGGAAGKVDPTQIQVQDLVDANGDRLLSTVKRELRKHHQFEAGFSFAQVRRGQKSRSWKIPTVCSTELLDTRAKSIGSGGLRLCDSGMGTASFVTGTFGLVAASILVEGIANHALTPPVGMSRKENKTESN